MKSASRLILSTSVLKCVCTARDWRNAALGTGEGKRPHEDALQEGGVLCHLGQGLHQHAVHHDLVSSPLGHSDGLT
ncbi:hypothetical protein EYF80_056867 [Liparis tanakae]|uniref:Uncharacterized protein n=1 Tax=Liparis tanakae TaxID=230148 RepID=A0A4Z2EVY4_9TELE|nr:hypothetical protein EYF80_056867 [Liparis tanakae]